MALKLIQGAERRWRRVNAPQLVAAVLHGVRFKDGVRLNQTAAAAGAAAATTGEVAA